MNQALTTAACRYTGNPWIMGHGAPEEVPQGSRVLLQDGSAAGNRALGTLELLQWQEADTEAAAPSKPGS